MVSTKRRRDDDDAETLSETPRKIRARILDDLSDDQQPLEAQTPSRRTQRFAEDGTPRSILKKTSFLNEVNGNGTTPKSTRKLLFETPTKKGDADTPNGTPTIVRNADRSARRKSNRRLLDRTLNGIDSDDDVLDEDDELAAQILSPDDEPTTEPTIAIEPPTPDPPPVPETPTKRGRGRPKGTGKHQIARALAPPPPTTLPAHEEYFWQTRPGGTKTSNNTLGPTALLNHDEYFAAMAGFTDPHQAEMDMLLEMHGRAFAQWAFELEEGFNVCLYGYGSKRVLLERFAAHLHGSLTRSDASPPKILIVNGYDPSITLKHILSLLATAILHASQIAKLPNQPEVLLAHLLTHLTAHPPQPRIHILLHSIDAPPLRRNPTPALLARLASHPAIALLCSADTPAFPLLWPLGVKSGLNMLCHDATTFAPYSAEIDVVGAVNALLGRSGRRVGGKEGVGFVLRSLPENGRRLFGLLVREQLALQDAGADADGDGDGDEDEGELGAPLGMGRARGSAGAAKGVEYRTLYHRAVEAFVCSSEVGFRTLLKEFYDHDMVESRRDALGTERLVVPFGEEELVALMEELDGEGV